MDESGWFQNFTSFSPLLLLYIVNPNWRNEKRKKKKKYNVYWKSLKVGTLELPALSLYLNLSAVQSTIQSPKCLLS